MGIIIERNKNSYANSNVRYTDNNDDE